MLPDAVVVNRVGMPLDEFMAEMERSPFELIDGEKKQIMSSVFDHMMVVHALNLAFTLYLLHNPIGMAFVEGTFVLPDVMTTNWVKGSRIPDMMFVGNDKFNAYLASPFARPGAPFAMIPDLTIEVISPTDMYSDVDRKVALYLQDGVQAVWVIDPQQKTATVHLANQTSLRLSGDAVLTGGDVLPGFELKLSDVFAQR